MPYHIAKSPRSEPGKPYAVINTADGEIMGCHDSRASANRQLVALYANRSKLPDLPPMVVMKKRGIANPIPDRLNSPPWRPDDAG